MTSGAYCKGCQKEADESAYGVPINGTVDQRLGCELMEFQDSKGRKPVAYSKIMEKLKVTREEVEAEAGKQNLVIDEVHFAVAEKKVKEASAGRPKAQKKKVTAEAVAVEDLFAQLVDEDSEDETGTVVMSESEEDTEEEKALQSGERDMMKEADLESKRAEKMKKNAEKKVQLEAQRAEKKAEELALKEQKKVEELALKEQKKVEELALKEQKKAEELALKEAKKLQLEADKVAREQKKAEELALKEQKKAEELALKEAKKLQLEADKVAKDQKIADEKKAKDKKIADEKKAKEDKMAPVPKTKEQKMAEALKNAVPQNKKEGTRTIVAEPKFKVGDVFVFRNGKDPVVDGTVTEVFAGKSFVEYNVDLGDKTIKTNEGFMMPKKAEMQAQAVAEEPVKKRVTVKRITIEGKQYLKTAENLLYDPETREEMGIYDPETNTIKKLPDDSEDEVSEDGYDSE